MRFKPPHRKRLQGAADARRRAHRRTYLLRQVPDNRADAVTCERLPAFPSATGGTRDIATPCARRSCASIFSTTQNRSGSSLTGLHLPC